jgi:spermidine/putrescine transport system permease protein
MRRKAIGIMAWTLVAYLYLPVVVVLVFAFQDSGRLALPFTGPSLRWFKFVLSEQTFRLALGASFQVGLVASLFAMLVGTLTGLAFTHYKLRLQRPLEALAMAPIALPGLFIGRTVHRPVASGLLWPPGLLAVAGHGLYGPPALRAALRPHRDEQPAGTV